MITLHQEIVNILKEARTTLTTYQIAGIVNTRRNYRKKDGSDVTAYQIHGRTKNYSNLFNKNGSKVSLKTQATKIDDNIPPVEEGEKSSEITTAEESDIAKTDYLVSKDFINLGDIGNLMENGLPKIDELKESGVYAVTKPSKYVPEFIEPDETTLAGNVINPWEITRLEAKWVEDADIIYYGIAGARSSRSLRSRINDLIKHGNGKTSDRGPHKGGEIFWQLKGNEKFSLWILPIKNPRLHEKNYLANFHGQTGKLPFANRQF